MPKEKGANIRVRFKEESDSVLCYVEVVTLIHGEQTGEETTKTSFSQEGTFSANLLIFRRLLQL